MRRCQRPFELDPHPVVALTFDDLPAAGVFPPGESRVRSPPAGCRAEGQPPGRHLWLCQCRPTGERPRRAAGPAHLGRCGHEDRQPHLVAHSLTGRLPSRPSSRRSPSTSRRSRNMPAGPTGIGSAIHIWPRAIRWRSATRSALAQRTWLPRGRSNARALKTTPGTTPMRAVWPNRMKRRLHG